jgi:signal transduction histidine kinase
MSARPSIVELARRPVMARLFVIGACAVVATVGRPTPQSLVPAVVLVLVALVSSARLPSSVPRWLQPTAEGLASAALIGALGSDGRAYAAYTLVPVTVAGLTCRPRNALITAAATATAYVGASVTAATPGQVGSALLDAGAWSLSLLSFWFLAVSVRRARVGLVRQPDPHYLDAHRLLLELQPVSRQLSLGLDPRTLAEALREELCELAGTVEGCVLMRTDGGRFLALAGEEPSVADETRLLTAWSGKDAVWEEPDGTVMIWLPIAMGEDRVALAVLTDPPAVRANGRMPSAVLRRMREVADDAGPRLASALLFDEVRRLATVDERNRLAREIHDGIAQDLASLAYLVDDARLDVDAETAARLGQVSDAVRSLVNELRLRLFDLRAGVSDTVSLGSAVNEYLQQVGAQTGLAVRLTLDEGTRRLPTSVEVEILRVLQEAVTNVRRHARASRVTVELSVHPPQAHLVVQDDGRGLQRARPNSLGLTGMRERAARIGAALAIGPGPDGGTRVSLSIDAASSQIPHGQAGPDAQPAGADDDPHDAYCTRACPEPHGEPSGGMEWDVSAAREEETTA